MPAYDEGRWEDAIAHFEKVRGPGDDLMPEEREELRRLMSQVGLLET